MELDRGGGKAAGGGSACLNCRAPAALMQTDVMPGMAWTQPPGSGRLEHFQEKPAPAKAEVESGFPSENATMQKC
jgi:hypothetical protein